MQRNYDPESSVYAAANLVTFLLLCTALTALVMKLVPEFMLRILLLVPLYMAAAYFEERILSRFVSRLVGAVIKVFKKH